MNFFPFEPFDLKNHLQDLPKSGKILVAPLNWGLGHATRCVPIIHQLLENGFEPILASDGSVLLFLQKQFPQLISYELPGYQITYAENPLFFNWKMMIQFPHILKTIQKEQQKTAEIVENENIKAIISDNRFGVKSAGIPSIFITHQLKISSGFGGFLATKWHQKIINSFDTVWIPDVEGTPNLSGDLSHHVPLKIPIIYIGILSAYQKEELPILYDLLILLSGPEPMRSQLEQKLLNKYRDSEERICLIRGVVESEVQKTQTGNITIFNFLQGKPLQDILNSSDTIIARSGYSTLMDLAVLQKRAILIPTPHQPEQEYLAKHVSNSGLWEIIDQKSL